MSDSGSGAEDPIDVLCHEFEQAWLRGERPQIESVLGRLTASERPEALSQLLLIELECLQKTQAVPDVDAYVARFPHDATLVRLVLRAFEGDASEIEAASVISERIGSEIGRYKLLEQIGVGGMGVVYMAEQLRPVRRRVALKIIKPGMDSKHVIARFEVERQALAMMEHPNIARVLDAGCTDSGRPYFVMELVRGIPITEYCDLNKLKSQERLQLFVMVCQAVQHAHTKGIIHRDIKPTNVLVTLHDGVPVPKVIDFGVAKATGQQLTERTLFTSFGQMVGTPLYMSPEQAELSGLDVDTRSDIYSLGVLLYELLTGTTPFDRQRLQAAALDEMRRIIREEEPEKPSTRVSTMGPASVVASSDRSTDPTKLRQQLREELDWIVMKALEKDRNRRYLTASDVAAEVTRYLNGDPIDAGPPSTAYRLRKIVGRYKSQVAVTCGFFALVLGFAVVASVLYVSADRARHSAIATKTDL
ncbi:MAG: serine/threonine protein kinase, partial [Planctomycetales bacterium]|nr:serine/threonine protein kinase [Planctomycetales bacterium]